jgi:hypothetical protein
MNVLVIGNGFDIEHGIPSSYRNFLDFIKIFKSIYGLRDSLKNINVNERKYFYGNKLTSISNMYRDVFCLWDTCKPIESHMSEFYDMINNNLWINYFLNPISQLEEKNNWVDIEAEILHIIQMLTENRELNFDAVEMNAINEKKETFLVTIAERLFGGEHGQQSMNQTKIAYWTKMKSMLAADFSNLIRALEIYLDYFVDFTKVKNSDIFDGIAFDRIITFNYTDIYHKLYNSTIAMDFIHGKADYKRDMLQSNVVLGIEEFLAADQKNNDLEFISYRKYYQRIAKRCDFSYRKYLEKNKDSLDVWIFGHSVASSDRDILTNLLPSSDLAILSANTTKSCTRKTYICYYNQQALEQQIVNLVRILGQDALNDLVCGANPKIEFVAQKDFNKKRHITMNETRSFKI